MPGWTVGVSDRKATPELMTAAVQTGPGIMCPHSRTLTFVADPYEPILLDDLELIHERLHRLEHVVARLAKKAKLSSADEVQSLGFAGLW